MNRLKYLSSYLIGILKEKTGLTVYSGLAPESDKGSHICVFITGGKPLNLIQNVFVWEEYSVIIHNWKKGGFDYETCDKIMEIDNTQGDDRIQSIRYENIQYLTDDIQEQWYGIATQFTIRVK